MILLKFATAINGDSVVDGHEKWITIDSLQFGVGRAISASGGGADRETSNPSFSEFTLTKSTDIASADLFMQAVCGKSLGQAQIDFIQTGGADKKQQVYMTLLLEEAIVSAYSASSGGDRPHESLSLNFVKISYVYNAFSGGKVTTGTPKNWDLTKNATY
ncbi:MAG TPA: type VI secretion system tube protein Hcp [Burkholderiaceae bacterium]|jgi:type VI secretion system secreted protein Hcp|nr:type VI secretion system tube protein Hcp [Burkholderiaceae bacterium]